MLPLDALRVEFMAGATVHGEDAWVHRKTVPYVIAAQVLTGAYEIDCAGESGRAEAGELFLTPPNQPLAIRHCGESAERPWMTARYLHVSNRLHGALDLGELLDLPLIVQGEDAARIGGLIADALADDGRTETRDLGRLARLQAVAYGLCAELLRIGRPRPGAAAMLDCPPRLLAVLRLMDESLAAALSVEDLAAAAELSRSRFVHVFTDQFGCGPMTYLRRRRIRRAQALLSQDDTAVGAIAEAVGFASVFHFSRVFKAETGMPPTAFRAAHPPLRPLLPE